MDIWKFLILLILTIPISFAIEVQKCVDISQAGEYEITRDFTVYEESERPVTDWWMLAETACIRVSTSDVILDCKGHSITNSDTDSIGIFLYNDTLDGVLNVTIRNCQVSGFKYGILAYRTYNSSFINNTVSDSSPSSEYYSNYEDHTYGHLRYGSGFAIYGINDILKDNEALNNGACGFHISGAQHIITGNLADGNMDGFCLDLLRGSELSKNTANENSRYDLNIDPSSCNVKIGGMTGSGDRPIIFVNQRSIISDVELSQLIVCMADGTTISNIKVAGSDELKNNGVQILYSSDVRVSNSQSVGNQYGFLLEGGSGQSITNSKAFGNIEGFSIAGSNGTYLNNEAYGNDWNGYYISGDHNHFDNNTAFNNGNKTFSFDGRTPDIHDFFDSESSGNGFFIYGPYNEFHSNEAYGNSLSGFNIYRRSSEYNVLNDNIAHDNLFGFSVQYIVQSTRFATADSHPYGNVLWNNVAHNNAVGFASHSWYNFIFGSSYDNEVDWDSESIGSGVFVCLSIGILAIPLGAWFILKKK